MADKILIVDDDPAICKLLEKVMHSNELETTTVNCGMDALSILFRFGKPNRTGRQCFICARGFTIFWMTFGKKRMIRFIYWLHIMEFPE